MVDSLDGAIKFQKDRGLDQQDFDSLNEATMLTEEVLELLGFDVPKHKRAALNSELVTFIGKLQTLGICQEIKYETEKERREHAIDSASDIIVVAVGTIMKLGYNPKSSLLECGKEINSRKGSMVDGKFEKDITQDPTTLYTADYSLCENF